MSVDRNFFCSIFLEYHPLFDIINRRCLSSSQLPLYETIRVVEHSNDAFIQPAETLFVFPNRTSVFGGHIIGLVIYAAQKTLTNNSPLHSLHSCFLTAAGNSSDILYTVSQLLDSKSCETRRATAGQDD